MTFFGDRSAKAQAAQAAKTVALKPADQRKTLKDLKVGDTAQIVDFIIENEPVRKIQAMGLRRGKKVTIMQKLGRGIVVKASNSRIVITVDVARNVEVK